MLTLIKTYSRLFMLTIQDIYTNIFYKPSVNERATGWLGLPHHYNLFKCLLLASETLLMSLWFVFYLLAKSNRLIQLALSLLIVVLIWTVPMIATVFSWVAVVFASALMLRTLLRMVASPEQYLIGAFARFASAHPVWTGVLTLVTLGSILVLTALLTGGAVVGVFAFLNPILSAVFSGAMAVYTGMQAYFGLVTWIALFVPLVMFLGMLFWVGRLRPFLVPSFFRASAGSSLLGTMLDGMTYKPIPFLLYLLTFSTAILWVVPNMLVASSVLYLLAWVAVSLVFTQSFLGDEIQSFERHKAAAIRSTLPLPVPQGEFQNAWRPVDGAAPSSPGIKAFGGKGYRLGDAILHVSEDRGEASPS